jgi:hypothetical protein
MGSGPDGKEGHPRDGDTDEADYRRLKAIDTGNEPLAKQSTSCNTPPKSTRIATDEIGECRAASRCC